MSDSVTPSDLPERDIGDATPSNECKSKLTPGTGTFPFLETADNTFCLPTYLGELLQSQPEKESELELLQYMRTGVTRPKLAEFAKCVNKWKSRGLNQATPIKAGDIQLPLFHWVVLTSSFELVDWLLGQGFDPNLKLPDTKWTPLHALSASLPWMGLCKKARLQQVIEPIVQNLAYTLAFQDKDLATPLHIVANHVGTGSNIDRLLYETLLGLMVLAVKSQVRDGNLIMKKQDKDGNTVLHLLATKRDMTKKAVSCIRAGSPVDICNNDGDTPYDIAIKNGLNDLADYLELPSDGEDTDNGQEKPVDDEVTVEVESSPTTSKEASVESTVSSKEVSVERLSPTAKRMRTWEPAVGSTVVRQRIRFCVTRRKSASDPSNKGTTRRKPQENEIGVEADSQTPPAVTSKTIVIPQSESTKMFLTEHVAGSSGSRESVDVSSIMEALVGSNVWEQVPGAASQVKRKLQTDLENCQKEVTVISRALETTQRDLEERRRYLERLQHDVYAVREEVHKLEDQEQRYRQRGRTLGDLLKETLEKMRRLEKFLGGSDHNTGTSVK